MVRRRREKVEVGPVVSEAVCGESTLSEVKHLKAARSLIIPFYEEMFKAGIMSEIEYGIRLMYMEIAASTHAKNADRLRAMTEIAKTEGMFVYRIREAIKEADMSTKELLWRLGKKLKLKEMQFETFEHYLRASEGERKERFSAMGDRTSPIVGLLREGERDGGAEGSGGRGGDDGGSKNGDEDGEGGKEGVASAPGVGASGGGGSSGVAGASLERDDGGGDEAGESEGAGGFAGDGGEGGGIDSVFFEGGGGGGSSGADEAT